MVPPMRIVVTGAAGFIGSHLAERLAADGHHVIGVDCFTDYYDPIRKQGNADRVAEAGVEVRRIDLRTDDLAPVVDGADRIVHAAAMPGLVRSWDDLQSYSDCNVVGTGRLVQASTAAGVGRIVHLSTSSVYGRLATGDERTELRPASPYGVTKLAAENLLQAYMDGAGAEITILRLFSVYGPRQRPDMAYSCFIEALLAGMPLTVYGDGTQTRSVTFVADCVEAIVRALTADTAGEVINIGGGQVISVLEVIAILGELLEVEPVVVHGDRRVGDQLHTRADTAKAERLLGWRPATRPRAGLEAQVAWRLQGGVPERSAAGSPS
jgi:UDP-glucuronate 4-epimerase